jgi:ABC-type spermidine/putrescine transport system permease subunit I
MTIPRDEAWVEAEGSGGGEREPTPRRLRRRGVGVTAGLLSVPMFWLVLFFLIPVVLVAMYSVGLLTLNERYDLYKSLDLWRYFLKSSIYLGTPLGRGLFWRSVKMSLGVSVTCVILSYPVAYTLALVAGRRKYTLLLVIIAPFLTSYLLRVLAWRVLLNPQGIFQSFLRDAHVLGEDDRIAWMFPSMFAVYLVLAYVWVPFVALPIFVSLESLDLHLLEASSDLGASRWTTFRRVTLPLSTPGVIAAFVFVFIPTLGEYITPQIVGGPGGQMFGNAIQGFFSQSFDWQLGSAMAMFLIFAVAILLVIFGRYLNVRTVVE